MCLTQIYTSRVGIRVYMSNRVEELERQVAELQAAVNGLTEELVEMKERVRQLEDTQTSQRAEPPVAADDPADDSTDETTDVSGERRTHSDDHVEVVERTGSDTPATSDGGTENTDDSVSGHTTPPADADDTTPTETDDETDDADSDSDIIVA